jgi:hypothetical protein
MSFGIFKNIPAARLMKHKKNVPQKSDNNRTVSIAD